MEIKPGDTIWGITADLRVRSAVVKKITGKKIFLDQWSAAFGYRSTVPVDGKNYFKEEKLAASAAVVIAKTRLQTAQLNFDKACDQEASINSAKA